MLLKQLQTSIWHGEKASQVIEKYGGFRNFVVVMRAFKMKRWRTIIHSWQRRFESDCWAKPTAKCQGNVSGTWFSISTVSDHLKQIGKVKKLDKWVPHCCGVGLLHFLFWHSLVYWFGVCFGVYFCSTRLPLYIGLCLTRLQFIAWLEIRSLWQINTYKLLTTITLLTYYPWAQWKSTSSTFWSVFDFAKH